MQARGISQDNFQLLVMHLQLYKAGEAPYNVACGGKDFKVRVWWVTCIADPTHPLRVLVLLLYDIDPTAARPERIFSLMGMNKTKTRNRMSVDTNGALTKIQSHYKGKTPKQLRNASRDEDAVSAEHASSSILMEVPTDAQPGEAADGEPEDEDEEEVSPDDMHELLASFNEQERAALQEDGLPTSFTALLTEHWDGYDLESNLFRSLDDPPAMADSALAAEEFIAEPTTSQFDVDALVDNMLSGGPGGYTF